MTHPRSATAIELGEYLRAARLAAGLSGPTLAAQLGVNQSVISRAEAGQRGVRAQFAIRWMDACQVEPERRHRILALVDAAASGGPDPVDRWRAALELDRDATQVRRFAAVSLPRPVSARYWRALAGDSPQPRQGRSPLVRVVAVEAALRWVPALPGEPGTSVRLLQAAVRRGVVRVRVIPTGRAAGLIPVAGFDLVDRPDGARVALCHTPAGPVTFDRPADVGAFSAQWQAAEDAALDEQASTALIDRLAVLA